MSAKMEISKKAQAKWPPENLKRLVYVIAAAFAGMGLVLLLGAMNDIPPLRQPDAVFGLSTRLVLIVAGMLHLAICGGLLAMRDPLTQGLVTCWTGLNHLVYLVGLAWLKAAAPLPVMLAVAWELRVSTRFVSIVWKLFIASLFIAGMLLVLVEWRRVKRVRTNEFLAHWGEMREGKVPSATQIPHASANIDNKAATKDSPRHHTGQRDACNGRHSEFKFSCPNCGQHIRCDRGYAGRQIHCPACHKQIQVPRAGTVEGFQQTSYLW
jgi:hypothetical protein